MARFSVHTGTIAPDPVVPGAVPVRAPPRCSAMTAPARAETRSCMHQRAGLQPREPKSPPPDQHACRFQLQRLGLHLSGPPISTLPPFGSLLSKHGLPRLQCSGLRPSRENLVTGNLELNLEDKKRRAENQMSHAPRLQTEKSFFILNLESVQLCPSPVLPHEISAQNCAGIEAQQILVPGNAVDF